MKTVNRKQCVRSAFIAAAVAALSMPLPTRMLLAQAEPARPAAAPAPTPAPLAPSTAPSTQPAKLDPSHVIITVGDDKVTVGDFEAICATLPPQQQAMVRGPARREMVEQIVKMKLLLNEARRRNVADTPKVKQQLEMLKEQVLVSAVVNQVQEGITEDVLRKEFEKNRQEWEKVAARHVLIRTPGSRVPVQPDRKELTEEQAKAKADDIYKRVTTGKEDFAKVAKAESDDTGSGADGGDLGSFNRGRMVAPFADAAFLLKEGEISKPVKTQFGWHVIQVTKRFDKFDDLKEQIRPQMLEQLEPQAIEKLITDLRAGTKVQIDEAFVGPPPAAPDLDLPPGVVRPGTPGTRPATKPASP